MRRLGQFGLVVGFAVGVATSIGCSSGGDAASHSGGAADVARTVERGPFERVVLLTGELDADDAVSVVAPRAEARQLTISYLVEDGATVRKGERLVEFDDSSFSSRLENQRVLLKQSKA